jgi:hypothetical protein
MCTTADLVKSKKHTYLDVEKLMQVSVIFFFYGKFNFLCSYSKVIGLFCEEHIKCNVNIDEKLMYK